MTVPGFVCLWCKHINVGNKTCKAFPDGIPGEIMHESYDHRHPFPGDNGIRFEIDPEKVKAAKFAAANWSSRTPTPPVRRVDVLDEEA